MAAISWFKLDVWLKACKNSVMGNFSDIDILPELCAVKFRPENACVSEFCATVKALALASQTSSQSQSPRQALTLAWVGFAKPGPWLSGFRALSQAKHIATCVLLPCPDASSDSSVTGLSCALSITYTRAPRCSPSLRIRIPGVMESADIHESHRL
jgi:hypothetical protein